MKYDVVGIGTGPLTLMRALRLAEQGLRVVLCDRGQDLGGAWAAPAVLGFENVEVGVHLLENRPAFIRALSDGLGVTLAGDACIARMGAWNAPMAPTRALLHLLIAAKALGRGQSDKARRSLLSAWRSARNVSTPFWYPVGGASQILQAAAGRLERLGGEMRPGVWVTEVTIGATEATVTTTQGRLEADRVLLSSRAFAPVTIDGASQRLEIEPGQTFSAVLHIRDREDGRKTSPPAYVEILNDPHIKRVRDVGLMSRPIPAAGERLLCVQYRQPPPGPDLALARYLLNHLERLGLLGGHPELIALYRSDLEVPTLTDRALLGLQESARGRIEAIRSTDFAEGFISAMS